MSTAHYHTEICVRYRILNQLSKWERPVIARFCDMTKLSNSPIVNSGENSLKLRRFGERLFDQSDERENRLH
jgi:hypothetical protein